MVFHNWRNDNVSSILNRRLITNKMIHAKKGVYMNWIKDTLNIICDLLCSILPFVFFHIHYMKALCNHFLHRCCLLRVADYKQRRTRRINTWSLRKWNIQVWPFFISYMEWKLWWKKLKDSWAGSCHFIFGRVLWCKEHLTPSPL